MDFLLEIRKLKRATVLPTMRNAIIAAEFSKAKWYAALKRARIPPSRIRSPIPADDPPDLRRPIGIPRTTPIAQTLTIWACLRLPLTFSIIVHSESIRPGGPSIRNPRDNPFRAILLRDFASCRNPRTLCPTQDDKPDTYYRFLQGDLLM